MTNLAEIKALLVQILAAVAALEAGTPTEPAPANPEAPFGLTLEGTPRFSPAYEACRTMLRAAEREGVFAISALLGGGIKQGAAHLYQSFKPNLQLIEDSIVALGKGPWGQDFLTDFENRATVYPEYCRKFGVKPVERRRDGTLAEIE